MHPGQLDIHARLISYSLTRVRASAVHIYAAEQQLPNPIIALPQEKFSKLFLAEPRVIASSTKKKKKKREKKRKKNACTSE